MANTPQIQAQSTVFDPPQVHNRDASEPHVQPSVYLTDALLEESTGICTGSTVQRGACPKHGDAACSHGSFLHVASQKPLPIHYISLDHSNAHKLTNHILHPLQATSLLLPGAPGKTLLRWCGNVPVSLMGTTGSFPRILCMGMTYRTGFL